MSCPGAAPQSPGASTRRGRMEREGWGREGCGAPQPGDAQLLGLLFARGKSNTPQLTNKGAWGCQLQLGARQWACGVGLLLGVLAGARCWHVRQRRAQGLRVRVGFLPPKLRPGSSFHCWGNPMGREGEAADGTRPHPTPGSVCGCTGQLCSRVGRSESRGRDAHTTPPLLWDAAASIPAGLLGREQLVCGGTDMSVCPQRAAPSRKTTT